MAEIRNKKNIVLRSRRHLYVYLPVISSSDSAFQRTKRIITFLCLPPSSCGGNSANKHSPPSCGAVLCLVWWRRKKSLWNLPSLSSSPLKIESFFLSVSHPVLFFSGKAAKGSRKGSSFYHYLNISHRLFSRLQVAVVGLASIFDFLISPLFFKGGRGEMVRLKIDFWASNLEISFLFRGTLCIMTFVNSKRPLGGARSKNQHKMSSISIMSKERYTPYSKLLNRR